MSPTFLHTTRSLQALLIALAALASVNCTHAQDAKPARTFIDYFLPTPI